MLSAAALVCAAATLSAPQPAGATVKASGQGHPASTVQVLLLGDSLATTLGPGLSEESWKYHIDLHDDGIVGCGITDSVHVEYLNVIEQMPYPCSPDPAPPGLSKYLSEPWPEQWKVWVQSDKPKVVMILDGRWEVPNRDYGGHWTDILHQKFADYTKSQLHNAIKIASAGRAHVVLLTTPCFDSGTFPDGKGYPEDNPTRIRTYNDMLYQAATSDPMVSVVDLFGMVCPKGKFSSSIDGVVVRSPDGIHFSLAGGNLLAAKILPTIEKLGRENT